MSPRVQFGDQLAEVVFGPADLSAANQLVIATRITPLATWQLYGARRNGPGTETS